MDDGNTTRPALEADPAASSMPNVAPPAVEVQSLHRRVRLHSPAADCWQHQALLVPLGSSDQQVLEWAAEFLSADAVAELREIIERQAADPQEP
jgi:hypothetical protein